MQYNKTVKLFVCLGLDFLPLFEENIQDMTLDFLLNSQNAESKDQAQTLLSSGRRVCWGTPPRCAGPAPVWVCESPRARTPVVCPREGSTGALRLEFCSEPLLLSIENSSHSAAWAGWNDGRAWLLGLHPANTDMNRKGLSRSGKLRLKPEKELRRVEFGTCRTHQQK